MMITFPKPRGFALAAASEFYAGFVPGSGMASGSADLLTLAFRLDRTFEAVGVALREEGDAIVAFATTSDTTTLRKQLARILGLDVDGDAWRSVGARDAKVLALQDEFPGFFTAAKSSPYDAAAWGVIAARMSIPAAAKLKTAIANAHGDTVELRGEALRVFPAPSRVLGIADFPGLSREKLARLHAVASAALEGKLDADTLRAMPEEDALASLQTIRGVGPWTLRPKAES
jgi:DNA-3-methyladenine glycosylase II